MFPARNSHLYAHSSMDNIQRVNHEQEIEASFHYDHASHNSVSGFRNLTLSDINPTAEMRRSANENRLEAAAATASYVPVTLDNWPLSGVRQNVNDRGMLYYPPMSPQPYIREDPMFSGMPQMYQPLNVFSSPNLASFPPNMQPFPEISPGAGYQYPNNATYQGLMTHYPQQIPVEENFTSDILSRILYNPFEFMNNPKLSRSLSTRIVKYRRTEFIDELIRTITLSRDSLVDAACSYHGSLVIQTLIEVAKSRSIIAQLPQVLAESIVLLMTDKYGMHTIKQCFTELDSQKYMPLIEKMMENDNLLYIARDNIGCRVLNDCLGYMVGTFKNLLLARIALDAKELAMDEYGTYVLQDVVDLKTIHTEKIVESIKHFIEPLITVKNGSHLLEKCLDSSYSSPIIEEIIKTDNVGRYALHECANYVIQKAIKRSRVTDYVLYKELVNILSKERATLEVNRHGKYVAKLLPEQ